MSTSQILQFSKFSFLLVTSAPNIYIFPTIPCRRYNVITQVIALKMHLISPACYSYLQSLGCMCLPHPRNLLKLCSNIGLENEFSSYLETATTNFNSLQCNVIIHMDEIHIKSDISYKEGKIIGSTLDSNEPSKTVFAVMVGDATQDRIYMLALDRVTPLFPKLLQIQ